MNTILQMNREDLRVEFKNALRDAVDEIKAIPDPPKLSDRCTLLEAAQITGLSRSMLYKLSMDGAIPRQKYGKRLVFIRKALTEWMDQRTISTLGPDEIMADRLSKSAKRGYDGKTRI